LCPRRSGTERPSQRSGIRAPAAKAQASITAIFTSLACTIRKQRMHHKLKRPGLHQQHQPPHRLLRHRESIPSNVRGTLITSDSQTQTLLSMTSLHMLNLLVILGDMQVLHLLRAPQ
jgi:hypothetical protein